MLHLDRDYLCVIHPPSTTYHYYIVHTYVVTYTKLILDNGQ